MSYRIGIGYDIHKLVKGRKLVLGGILVPFDKGLLAYSDGDVVIHAICDALLGASGLGDIGLHFPDSDKKYKGISSLELLKETVNKVRACGCEIINIDTVIIADKPKLSPYRKAMVDKLQQALKVNNGVVNIKAATNEGIGPVGSRAIASYAVALLEKDV